MNDLYAEAGVKRSGDAKSMGFKALIIVGMIAGIFMVLLGSFFSIIGAVLVVFLGYMFTRLDIEYEYVFVDGQLDFDKIMGKSKRKNMLRIDFEHVEIMAPANSHSLDSYTHAKLVIKDYSSGKKESKPYIIVANVNNQKTKIIFEPSTKMIECIKVKNNRKVVEY